MYFRTKFALFFRFLETSGKQYVLWTLDSLGSTKHTVSLRLSQ